MYLEELYDEEYEENDWIEESERLVEEMGIYVRP